MVIGFCNLSLRCSKYERVFFGRLTRKLRSVGGTVFSLSSRLTTRFVSRFCVDSKIRGALLQREMYLNRAVDAPLRAPLQV